jgi:hypothetical protein
VARPVISGRRHFLGVRRVDDDRGQAVPVERDRQSQADQAAAEDDDVRALHGRSFTVAQR